MSHETDVLGALITAVMLALIRVIDAWIVLEAGLPAGSLEPTPLADLDAEARRYADGLIDDRKAAE